MYGLPAFLLALTGAIPTLAIAAAWRAVVAAARAGRDIRPACGRFYRLLEPEINAVLDAADIGETDADLGLRIISHGKVPFISDERALHCVLMAIDRHGAPQPPQIDWEAEREAARAQVRRERQARSQWLPYPGMRLHERG